MTEFEKQLIQQLQTLNTTLATLNISALATAVPALIPAVAPCSFTFGEWLLHWQEKYKKHKQSDEVYKWNLNRIVNYITPALGNLKLTDITADHVQDYLNTMPPSNARDKMSFIFSGSLRKAYDLGHIIRNPYKAVETEKNQSESYPVLQPPTQAKLLRVIDSDKYKRMFMFYCCTGFRLSEGLSINPQTDIDFKRNIISLAMADKKTKKHKRTVPFLPQLFKDFDLTANSLFPDITRNSARQYFSKLFKREDIDACIHSFRHTFISSCYHVGIPAKYIQEWVGHSSIIMTMDRYTHILEGKNTPVLEYLKQLKNSLKI